MGICLIMTMEAVASLATLCEAPMKLNHYVRQLTVGVLRNTHFSEVDFRKPHDMVPILTMVQEALTRLYSRFLIRERHLILEMRVGITFYHLTKLYSMTGHDPERVPYPYIMDLPNDPFEEDVLKVLQVTDSNNNIRPLNDPERHDSLYTVQFDVLQNSYPRDLEALFVTYQANHPLLVRYEDPKPEQSGEDLSNVTPADPNDLKPVFYKEIMLPQALYPALDNYVSYLAHTSINTPESLAKAALNMQVYEQICREAERMDLINNSMACTNTRFRRNGWK